MDCQPVRDRLRLPRGRTRAQAVRWSGPVRFRRGHLPRPDRRRHDGRPPGPQRRATRTSTPPAERWLGESRPRAVPPATPADDPRTRRWMHPSQRLFRHGLRSVWPPGRAHIRRHVAKACLAAHTPHAAERAYSIRGLRAGHRSSRVGAGSPSQTWPTRCRSRTRGDLPSTRTRCRSTRGGMGQVPGLAEGRTGSPGRASRGRPLGGD